MNISLDREAKMPTKAYDTDAGFDIYSRERKVVPARGSAIFDTGVHIELPKIKLWDGHSYSTTFHTAGF